MKKLMIIAALVATTAYAVLQVSGEYVLMVIEEDAKLNAPAEVQLRAATTAMGWITAPRTPATVFSDAEYVKAGTNILLSCYHKSIISHDLTDAKLSQLQEEFRSATNFNTEVLWLLSTDAPWDWLESRGIVQRSE